VGRPTSNYTHRLSDIRVTEEMDVALSALAAAKGITVSDLVRTVLARHLDRFVRNRRARGLSRNDLAVMAANGFNLHSSEERLLGKPGPAFTLPAARPISDADGREL
jgi:hypothetical protein